MIEDEKTVGVMADPRSDLSESGEEDAPALPFSKARCIALVATVTGASFLNVYFISMIRTSKNRQLMLE